MRRPALALIVLTAFGAAAAAAPAAAQAGVPSIELPAELDRVLRDYEREWKAGNAAALAALFTEDGMTLSNGRPPVRGRADITRAYATSRGDLRLRAVAYAAADTVGYIVGLYRWGSDTTDTGKFVLALRRAPKGRWLIAADIDNTMRPAPRN